MISSTKSCTRCGHDKPLDQFYANPETYDGLRRQCRECDLAVGMHRGRQRRRAFGPVPHDHVCPICSRRSAAEGYTDWHLDHDHGTETIRNYVCRGCNINMDRYVGAHPLAAATSRYLALYEHAH